ncbi:MAG: hypothetical protein KIT29_03600 [Anaerolineales bacterium]|nr:hypothetical protein [Anaerolineales bacterium]MCW5838977.1 hypothetical protein [Anaerolineales bacterium]
MYSFIYNAGKLAWLKGEVQPLLDALRVALVTAEYVANKDSHQVFADISNEVVGTGYSAGGQLLSGVVLTQDDANDRAVLQANSPLWAVGAFTARAALLYKDSGNPATSPLLAYMNFGADHTVSGEDFNLEWSPEGVLYLGE